MCKYQIVKIMMDWKRLISAKRFGMEEFHEERQENRSEFQRDYDRLVFSAPFRRLQNKTQVFPLPGSIFVHNRLTHSLEVSCVGRSLGNDVSKAILARQPKLQDSFLPEIGSISLPPVWRTTWVTLLSVTPVKRPFLPSFQKEKELSSKRSSHRWNGMI